MNDEGIKFLDKLYKDLYKSDEVTHRVSEKDIVKHAENIEAYLDRLERIHNKANKNEANKELLKKLYYEKYVIKKEDIPQYQDANKIIEAQERTLSRWIDYLTDENANYPMWAKYWAFQSMLKIGTYNEASDTYQKRNSKTIAPFVDVNPEALARCISSMTNYIDKKEPPEEELKELIERGNFTKLYTILLKKNKTIILNNSDIYDGIWKKYNRNTDDYIELSNSLQNKNTGWCTADINTAKGQLHGDSGYIGGDFYVYYTRDNEGKYETPRIAIRLGGNTIEEIRGVSDSQNLEDGLEEIVERKLKDINTKDIDNILKKINNSKLLTRINKKNANNETLNDEELFALYEVNKPLTTFGWRKDPRIDKIKEIRKSNNLIKNDINKFSLTLNRKDFINFIAINPDCLLYISEQTPELCLAAINKEPGALQYVKEQTPELCWAAVNKNPYALRYVKDQTPELCLAAINEEPLALMDVRNQTPELCLAAINKDPWILQYVRNQTPELCLAAINKEPRALSYVKDQTPELCLAAVKQDGYALKDVKEQTPELCLAAVKQDGYALKYVKEQTPELCLAAVKQDGYALKYVKEQTPELYWAAINKKPRALSYVKDQTPELCLAAINKDPLALMDVRNQTPELCWAAIKIEPLTLEDIRNQTPELCLAAVNKNPYALRYVKDQTPELCLAAINKDPWALCYVEEQTPELCLAAINKEPRTLSYVKKQTPELCLAAVNKEPGTLQYVKDQTHEICIAAVKQDALVLQYVKEQTSEICMAAVKQNIYAIGYVKNPTPELEKFYNKYEKKKHRRKILI